MIPEHLKTKEMCSKAVHIKRSSLHYCPDQYKTQKLYNRKVRNNSYTLVYVRNHLKNQKMFNEVRDIRPAAFKDAAVREDP